MLQFRYKGVCNFRNRNTSINIVPCLSLQKSPRKRSKSNQSESSLFDSEEESVLSSENKENKKKAKDKTGFPSWYDVSSNPPSPVSEEDDESKDQSFEPGSRKGKKKEKPVKPKKVASPPKMKQNSFISSSSEDDSSSDESGSEGPVVKKSPVKPKAAPSKGLTITYTDEEDNADHAPSKTNFISTPKVDEYTHSKSPKGISKGLNKEMFIKGATKASNKLVYSDILDNNEDHLLSPFSAATAKKIKKNRSVLEKLESELSTSDSGSSISVNIKKSNARETVKKTSKKQPKFKLTYTSGSGSDSSDSSSEIELPSLKGHKPSSEQTKVNGKLNSNKEQKRPEKPKTTSNTTAKKKSTTLKENSKDVRKKTKFSQINGDTRKGTKLFPDVLAVSSNKKRPKAPNITVSTFNETAPLVIDTSNLGLDKIAEKLSQKNGNGNKKENNNILTKAEILSPLLSKSHERSGSMTETTVDSTDEERGREEKASKMMSIFSKCDKPDLSSDVDLSGSFSPVKSQVSPAVKTVAAKKQGDQNPCFLLEKAFGSAISPIAKQQPANKLFDSDTDSDSEEQVKHLVEKTILRDSKLEDDPSEMVGLVLENHSSELALDQQGPVRNMVMETEKAVRAIEHLYAEPAVPTIIETNIVANVEVESEPMQGDMMKTSVEGGEDELANALMSIINGDSINEVIDIKPELQEYTKVVPVAPIVREYYAEEEIKFFESEYVLNHLEDEHHHAIELNGSIVEYKVEAEAVPYVFEQSSIVAFKGVDVHLKEEKVLATPDLPAELVAQAQAMGAIPGPATAQAHEAGLKTYLNSPYDEEVKDMTVYENEPAKVDIAIDELNDFEDEEDLPDLIIDESPVSRKQQQEEDCNVFYEQEVPTTSQQQQPVPEDMASESANTVDMLNSSLDDSMCSNQSISEKADTADVVEQTQDSKQKSLDKVKTRRGSKKGEVQPVDGARQTRRRDKPEGTVVENADGSLTIKVKSEKFSSRGRRIIPKEREGETTELNRRARQQSSNSETEDKNGNKRSLSTSSAASSTTATATAAASNVEYGGKKKWLLRSQKEGEAAPAEPEVVEKPAEVTSAAEPEEDKKAIKPIKITLRRTKNKKGAEFKTKRGESAEYTTVPEVEEKKSSPSKKQEKVASPVKEGVQTRRSRRGKKELDIATNEYLPTRQVRKHDGSPRTKDGKDPAKSYVKLEKLQVDKGGKQGSKDMYEWPEDEQKVVATVHKLPMRPAKKRPAKDNTVVPGLPDGPFEPKLPKKDAPEPVPETSASSTIPEAAKSEDKPGDSARKPDLNDILNDKKGHLPLKLMMKWQAREAAMNQTPGTSAASAGPAGEDTIGAAPVGDSGGVPAGGSTGDEEPCEDYSRYDKKKQALPSAALPRISTAPVLPTASSAVSPALQEAAPVCAGKYINITYIIRTFLDYFPLFFFKLQK